MSTPSTTTGNGGRLVLPVVAVAAVLVALLIFTKCTGDDAKKRPVAAKPTAAAKVSVTKDSVKGGGNAPDEIAISTAAIARSATALGMTSTIPKFKLDKVAEFALDVEQDGGKTVYHLAVVRDARGKFINPRLTQGEGDNAAELACNSTFFRATTGKFSIALPLQCLDDPKAALKARMTIKTLDGDTEETTFSKSLEAPQ